MDAEVVRLVREVVHERRLSDPGFPTDDDRSAAPVSGALPRTEQRLALLVAAQERGGCSCTGAVVTGDERPTRVREQRVGAGRSEFSLHCSHSVHVPSTAAGESRRRVS